MIESRGEPRKWLWPALLLVSVLIATVVQLRLQGRLWWCACGQSFLWAGDIWSSHNSQHFVDPYSFSHMLHGVVFCVVLAWVAPRLSHGWRFVIAGILEAAWEVAENSTFVIQRYREATSAVGYEGDTVINSMSDVVCCLLGYLLARRIGWRWSIAVYVVTELALLIWVRDNLTLNVLMLMYPIDAIRTWQMAH